MNRLVVRSRVDPDGVLRIAVPVGVAKADHEMLITVEPVPTDSDEQQEYSDWLDSIEGQWQGEFERMPQGEWERRDPPLMYLLDSNAWITVFRGRSASLLNEFKRHSPAVIFLCPVVVAELWYGVCRSPPARRAANESLVRQVMTRHASAPFDDAAALDAAQLRADLDAAGQPIGPHDLLIAAIARTHGLTLVTHNTAEFSRVPRLNIEDWEIP